MRRLEIPKSLVGVRETLRQIASADHEVERSPQEALRPEFIASLKRLDLRAKILLRSFIQGLHRSPLKGFSSEFSDYRNFSMGDDSRWIDWRLYARTDRLYVKCFESESAMRATIVVDATASMGFRSAGPCERNDFPIPVFSKLGYGVTLAAAFAYLLQAQRDRIGLYLIGAQDDFRPSRQGRGLNAGNELNEQPWHEKLIENCFRFLKQKVDASKAKWKQNQQLPEPESTVKHLPPRSNRNHLMRLIQELSALKAGGQGGIAEALENLAAMEKRRGMVIIFTDGLSERARFMEALRRLKHRGHDLIVFQIWDPFELYPKISPGIGFRDPETKASFDPLPLKEYQARAENHLSEFKSGCQSVGCDYQFMFTTDAFDHALFKFMKLRNRKY